MRKSIFWIIVLSLFFIYNSNYVSAKFNQTDIDNSTLLYACSGRNAIFDGSRYNTTNGSVQGATTFNNDAGCRFSGSAPDRVNFSATPTTSDPYLDSMKSFLVTWWYGGPKVMKDIGVFATKSLSNFLPCPSGWAIRTRTAPANKWQAVYCLTAAEGNLQVDVTDLTDWHDNDNFVCMWTHYNITGTTLEIAMGVNGTGLYGTIGKVLATGSGTLEAGSSKREVVLGGYPDSTGTLQGNISHLSIYNITDNAQFNLTQAVNFTCNGGVRRNLTTYTQAGVAPPAPTPAIPNLTVTTLDSYDNSTISNFSIRIFNTTYSINDSTQNGTILVNNINSYGIYNITFSSSNQSGGYFNRTFLKINISGGSYQGRIYQSIIIINASEIISNNLITSFTAAAPLWVNSSNSSGYVTLFVKAGKYNISGDATNYLTNWVEVNARANSTYYTNVSLGTNNLTVRVFSIPQSIFVQNFTITLTSKEPTYNYTTNKTTTNASIVFPVIAGNYNLVSNAIDYVDANLDISVTLANIYPNVTINVFRLNSINFTIRDEFNDEVIKNGTLVKINIIGDPFANNYTTINGTLFVDLLEPSDYRITYESAKYTQRDYFIKVINRTNQSATLYLLSTGNSTSIAITIQDESGRAISNATVKAMRYFIQTNAYRIVVMGKTAIDGKTTINLQSSDPYYKFLVEKFDGLLLETSPAKVFETAYTLRVKLLSDIFIPRQRELFIIRNLSFSNVTNTFRFTYTDPTGLSVKTCLVVEELTQTGNKRSCTHCDIAASGTLLCDISGNITSNNTFIAKGYLLEKGEDLQTAILLDVITIANSAITTQIIRTFGTLGVFLTFIMIGVITAIGIFNPVAAVILNIFGLIISISIFGFATFGPQTLLWISSLAILGGIIIYRIGT